MAKTVTLYYGGEKFSLPESHAKVLRDMDPDETGTLRMNLENGTWLTIVYGPSIPLALLEEEDIQPSMTVLR